jgi:hypothetical protein
MAGKPIDIAQYDGLDEFATVRQLEYLEALRKHGSVYGAAKECKVAAQVMHEGLRSLKAKAAQHSRAPHIQGVPEGFRIKGTSTYFDEEGKPRAQWVKTTQDQEQRERLVREFVEELCASVKGKAPKVKPPKLTNSDLLAVYPIGDHHHGMKADGAETGGESYDIKISSHILSTAIDYLAELAPPAETALLINVGDFFHANDQTNATPASGNALDVDSRYGKIMESGAMALIRGVLRLLEKHQHVVVWNLRGNHDPEAALALSIAMRMFFFNEPRVTIDMGRSLYKFHRFGKNLIGGHHGHGAKAADLPLLMANDRAEDWGATEHRVWHCGHIHHKTQKEYVGCTVETHRTLAPGDAWHHGEGYRSKRDMNAIVYHQDFGEVQRTRFDPAMVK